MQVYPVQGWERSCFLFELRTRVHLEIGVGLGGLGLFYFWLDLISQRLSIVLLFDRFWQAGENYLSDLGKKKKKGHKKKREITPHRRHHCYCTVLYCTALHLLTFGRRIHGLVSHPAVLLPHPYCRHPCVCGGLCSIPVISKEAKLIHTDIYTFSLTSYIWTSPTHSSCFVQVHPTSYFFLLTASLSSPAKANRLKADDTSPLHHTIITLCPLLLPLSSSSEFARTLLYLSVV